MHMYMYVYVHTYYLVCSIDICSVLQKQLCCGELVLCACVRVLVCAITRCRQQVVSRRTEASEENTPAWYTH